MTKVACCCRHGDKVFLYHIDRYQQEHKKVFRSYSNNSSTPANSQVKFQSRPADNLSVNSTTAKPSGEISYASNNVNVVAKETFRLMDDLNLQELHDRSILWEAPVDYLTIAETGATYTGEEVEISKPKSDSKKSEQLKVRNLRKCVYVCCACVCMHASMHVCVLCVCMYKIMLLIINPLVPG